MIGPSAFQLGFHPGSEGTLKVCAAVVD